MKQTESKAVEIMKKVYNEEISGAYVAATLDAGGFAFHPKAYEPVEGMFDRDEQETQDYSVEEKYWWSKCYVKHKTPSHAYYQESVDIINNYENN